MLEVEVLAHGPRPGLPAPAEVRRLSRLAAGAADVHDGHVAIEFVDPQRIAQLNADHRGQTTRRAIRGIHRSGERELVFIDLPGVQRPRDALTARMAARVRTELAGADMALLLLDGEQGVGSGDRYIAHLLADGALPVTVAVNKVDRLTRAQTLQTLAAAAELGSDWELFPISA